MFFGTHTRVRPYRNKLAFAAGGRETRPYGRIGWTFFVKGGYGIRPYSENDGAFRFSSKGAAAKEARRVSDEETSALEMVPQRLSQNAILSR